LLVLDRLLDMGAPRSMSSRMWPCAVIVARPEGEKDVLAVGVSVP
jgi:hypothetical protein